MVWIIIVEKEEESLALMQLEPLKRQACCLVPFPFVQLEDLVLFLEAVVVSIEALTQVEFRVQNEAAE